MAKREISVPFGKHILVSPPQTSRLIGSGSRKSDLKWTEKAVGKLQFQ
jgi:hypothetical protein